MQTLVQTQHALMDKARAYQQEVEEARLAKVANKKVTVFVSGDLVLLSPPDRPTSKVAVVWRGPYVVSECRTRTYHIVPLSEDGKKVWVDIIQDL